MGCRRLTAPDAEMLYMQEVERMDGYGEESYPAKVSIARRPGLSRLVLRALRGLRGGPGTSSRVEAGDVQKPANLKARSCDQNVTVKHITVWQFVL